MIVNRIAKEFGIKLSQVEATIKLIDEGNTIPFIARYRKEATGGLTDETLRDLDERLKYLRNLEERKEEVIRLIDEQGKLTEELKDSILEAEVLQRVEDLYKPFRKKKATRASKAREKGLEPLALIIKAMEHNTGSPQEFAQAYLSEEVETVEEALSGAADIIAEIIADDPDLNQGLRNFTYEHGKIITEAVSPDEITVYDMYKEYEEAVKKIPDHRILAINRGEKEKKLKVKVNVDIEKIIEIIEDAFIVNRHSIFLDIMKATVEDAYKRLMAPSIEREIRNILTERAENNAVKIFAKNTEKLLMTPPVKNMRVLAIDPGFRTGCKVTALDETGKLLEFNTIYPNEPRNDFVGSKKVLTSMITKHNLNVIAIGNGTASRETQLFVAELIKESGLDGLHYTIVNEAGASIYSASKLAAEEYPDLDVTTRGTMSIGRRFQDPLSELVKIHPRHIGVGQYQHDINQKVLESALTNIVEDCVNRVGVDLNTASPSLLSYISGINSAIAKNIVAYRETKGKFKNRKELMKIPKLGEKTFKQCAGFMRISEGDNPLDATAVHPESYEVTEIMLEKLGIEKTEIVNGGAKNIDKLIIETFGSFDKMAEALGVGTMTLNDIVNEIKKPARDPREDMPKVVFRNDVLSIEDLKPDMELTGTVRNVVDFGAFVDIGIKNDGLVHVSELSHKYVKHPMDVVSIGDTVKVKVISVDYDREKVSLTMKI
ncbi:MAG: RNA-binding transcriptional accessory protein [Clostridiales bacterium]|jgi:uncharacterized protein|nr:RNA-binding transcriptional accessory protein [Clostridiales bacterium]